MSVDFEKLKSTPRILIEAALKPVAGTRIQPTGFPDLGPATYDAPDGTPTLLVESAQSMANRLEAVCWDEGNNTIAEALKGLPYILVKLAGLGDGNDTTTSLQEFHRLNSPYILQKQKDSTRTLTKDGKWFREVVAGEIGLMPASTRTKKADKAKATDAPNAEATTTAEKESDDVPGVVDLRKLAQICFKYDPNSLIHGVFLEKLAGRLRHPRALSAFIEASGAERVDSGGVKFDRALPSAKVVNLDASEGFGNVPFHRTEFTAKTITAYFSIDLAQIRGYGLSAEATNLLIAISLWKTRQFLDSNMRLRSACELEIDDKNGGVQGKRPEKFILPSSDALETTIGDLIKKCAKLFANPTITELTWNNPKGKDKE